ncbi:MAG: acetyl-CoA carboxylase biotin carboxylase subunit [Chloroflexi bacterium]|nr:acetyl-CoA carboxylase biotin carboxylase subunit [Chloroflexota bacterium]
MLEKVLVANRGEMAVRVIRACHDLGIETVAIYSEADADSLPVRIADESVCIGPAASSASYLNVPNIIGAALNTGADAVHPGAGFLAENAYFAEVCARYNLMFVGPAPDTIRSLGDKVQARAAAVAAGLPVVPGSEEPVRDATHARQIARDIGFPVVLKAAAGGGGRGIRPVADPDELTGLFSLAQAEARASFGSGDLYVEKLIESPRHVEVQVIGDGTTVVHAWHRECSIQRRYQKLIEEAPAPNLPHGLSDDITQAAVRLMQALDYRSAGTVEFLVDASGDFFFMEANARIQVEHPITEAITGLDVVAAQLAIAGGDSLGVSQEDVGRNGHAIEFRLTAEDPTRDFRPDSGRIARLHLPGGYGVRVDTHVYAGYEVPPFYDSLLAKLIVWGETRAEAVDRARRTLAETLIEGPATNLAFHQAVLDDAQFAEGTYDVGYVEALHDRVAGVTA